MRRKRGRVINNMYKEHMDKAKGGVWAGSMMGAAS